LRKGRGGFLARFARLFISACTANPLRLRVKPFFCHAWQPVGLAYMCFGPEFREGLK